MKELCSFKDVALQCSRNVFWGGAPPPPMSHPLLLLHFCSLIEPTLLKMKYLYSLLSNIHRLDNTLEEIIFKLVPGLRESESNDETVRDLRTVESLCYLLFNYKRTVTENQSSS